MQTKDVFSARHPAVSFLYFTLVLVFSMFWMHPVCLAISLVGAVCYVLALRGPGGLVAHLVWLLPVALLAAGLNPLFNHQGVTTLAWLPDGNPLTLESIAYGSAAAVMLAAVLLWFVCFHTVMTSDRLICLFGRVIPALSLVLTMALRFIPRFKRQFRLVREAQLCLEGQDEGKRLTRRLGLAVSALGAVLTWSLENAIDTADSMVSRGYGLPGRTSFSLYRFTQRDWWTVTWLGSCGLFLCLGWALGGLEWRYFPAIKGTPFTPLTASLFVAYLALCLTPVACNVHQSLRWGRAHREVTV